MRGIALLALFTAGAVGAVIVHSNLPATRRVFTRVLADQLSHQLTGQVRIEGCSALRLASDVELTGVQVLSPQGTKLVSLSRVRVRANFLSLLWRAVVGEGPLEIAQVELGVVDLGDAGKPVDVSALAAVFARPGSPRTPAPRDMIVHSIALQRLHAPFARAEVSVRDVSTAASLGARGTTLSNLRLRLSASASPSPRAGTIAFVAELEGHVDTAGTSRLGLKGRLDDQPVALDASMTSDRAQLRLNLSTLRAATARVIWPSYGGGDASVDLSAEGTRSRVEVIAHVKVGSSRANLEGDIDLVDDGAARLRFEAERLDPRDLGSSIEATAAGKGTGFVNWSHRQLDLAQLRFDGAASGWGESARVGLSASVDTRGLAAELNVAHDAWRARGAVRVTPEGDADGAVCVAAPRVSSLRRLVPALAGARGSMSTQLAFHHDAHSGLAARLRVEAASPRFKNASASNARVDAELTSPVSKLADVRPSNLRLSALLHGQSLEVADNPLGNLEIAANGALLSPRLDLSSFQGGYGTWRGSLLLDLSRAGRQQATAIELQLDDPDAPVRARIREVVHDANSLRVEGIVVDTNPGGRLTAHLRAQAERLDGSIDAQGLDLERLAHLANLPGSVRGKLNGRAVVGNRVAAPTVEVALQLTDAEAAGLSGISAQAEAHLESGDLSAQIVGDAERLGTLDGRAHVMARLTRKSGQPSEAQWSLVISGLAPGALLGPLDARLDVDHGRAGTRAHLAMTGRPGLIATATAQTLLGLDELWKARTSAQRIAFGADLRLERPLPLNKVHAALKNALGVVSRGQLALQGPWERLLGTGTLQVEGVAARSGVVPLDLSLKPRLERESGRLTVLLEASQAGRQVAAVDLKTAELDALFSGRVPDDACLSAVLTDFPLEQAPSPESVEISGQLSGSLDACRRREALVIDGALTAELALNGTRIEPLELSIASRTGRLALHVHDSKRRAIDVSGNAAIQWNRGAPSLDQSSPALVEGKLTAFPVEAVSPLVHEQLSELRGALDVSGRVLFMPSRSPDGTVGGFERLATLSGHLRGGVVQIARSELELRDVQMDAELVANQRQTSARVALRGRAGAESGNLKATAIVASAGPGGVRGRVDVEGEHVPVVWEGTKLGTFGGRARATLVSADDGCRGTVVVERANLSLEAGSSRELVPLEWPDYVRSAQRPSEPSRGSRACAISLDLGTNVWLSRPHALEALFSNDDTRLRLLGQPEVRIGAPQAQIDGGVTLGRGGRILAVGRPLDLDHGYVYFENGQPDAPNLRATTTWTAPNGTIVYADLSGDTERPFVALRSIPAKEKEDIIALVLGDRSALDYSVTSYRWNRLTLGFIQRPRPVTTGLIPDRFGLGVDYQLGGDSLIGYEVGTHLGQRFYLRWQKAY